MMRKSLFAFAVLVSVSIMIAPARAQDASPDLPGFANPVRIVGTLIGNGTLNGSTCTTGFSNRCPSGDSCTCLTVMDARFTSSRIGSGRANLFLTMDNTATFGPLGNKCTPIYGEIDAIARKDSPIFDIWGAACSNSVGNQAANGAMGLANSVLFDVSGYATFTSTISRAGHVVLRFDGAAQ